MTTTIFVAGAKDEEDYKRFMSIVGEAFPDCAIWRMDKIVKSLPERWTEDEANEYMFNIIKNCTAFCTVDGWSKNEPRVGVYLNFARNHSVLVWTENGIKISIKANANNQ